MAANGGDRDTAARILVLANETAEGEALQQEIARRARGPEAEVLVVCPALNTRLRHWLSDVDNAVAAAAKRLTASLAALEDRGIFALGYVGDADPAQALGDAVRTFRPTEIVISTHPPGRSNWLERRLIESARASFAVPITHVVVDLEAEARARDSSASSEIALVSSQSGSVSLGA